jgi:ATP-dependent Clp protease ATP-binding subunit ClpB
VDETIIFHSLSKKDMRSIIDIQLQRLVARLEERKYKLTVTDAAKEFLVDAGFNPLFGARPLKRAIQRFLEDPLAMELLAGRYLEGDHILVGLQEGKLHFST